MASLSIDNTELRENLALVLGINRDVSTWAADPALESDVQRIIRAGRRKMFGAHRWGFLVERYTFVTPVAFSSGTIEVINGVVTLTGDTWPAAIADYLLVPNTASSTSGVHTIASRDSDTQVTLNDTSVDADALTTYSAYRISFDFPTNFEAFLDPLTIEGSRSGFLREITVLPEYTIRAVGGARTPKFGRPEAFAVFMDVAPESSVPTPKLTVYPIPDQQYTVTGRVRIMPGDGLAESGDVCHPVFADLLMTAILSAAEEMYQDGRSTVWTDKFERDLPRYILKDRTMRGTRGLAPRDSFDELRDPLYDLKQMTVHFTPS